MHKIYIFLFAAGIVMAGCDTTRPAAYDGYSNSNFDEESDQYYLTSKTDEKHRSEVSNANSNDERLIIYNAYLDMTVKNIDSASSTVSMIAKKYGGYILESGSWRTVIRVKASELNNAIAEIESLGELESKNVTGSDVTEEYTDYQIRLENAKKARERYLELLSQAENVEASLLVEKELERLNNDIELLEGKINKLGHLAEYSTITIDLREKVKLGVLGYVTVGLYEGVKWLFVR